MRWLSRRDFLKFGPAASNTDDPLVHIASLVVQATDAGSEAVRALIDSMPGAELHETGHPGKLAIVLEAADSRALADATTEIQQLSGVLTVSIVAHLMESASSLEEQHDDQSTTVPTA
jgi:nitrate reductase NapD